MNKENFRFYTKVRTALNIPPGVILDELYCVCDDQAPSFVKVKKWAKRFHEDREEVEDEARPSRPVIETTPENIKQVRVLTDDDPYITAEGMQDHIGLSYDTIQ
ncbi:unnamed protein product [Rotaria sordida]|uniref:Mos1 transposase HTH domain-containing protein n=1 Tax=Rotaria sordida TaxID=392033 RepID=A0A814VDK9_9BILA|nr:unnamed protein product [Rotaria sordida]